MNQLPPANKPKRDPSRRTTERKPKRKDPYVAPEGKRGVANWIGRLMLLFIALTLCGTASLLLFWRWQQAEGGGRIAVEGGDINLGTVEQLYLESYLAARAGKLNEPAGAGADPVDFVIDSGQTANDITANLQANGLVADTTLFLNYVKYYGLDAQLEAGTYNLTPQMTIPEIATRLTRSVAENIELRFLEGWRAEEMAAYLASVQPANIDSQQFLAIVERRQLFDLVPYDFMASHPQDATLEGFLFPDTYRVPLDADANYLVGLMLDTFGTRVTPTMRQLIGAQGLSLREAVTLASIVEREGVLNAERATIASVFYNRLAIEMKLEADPTIQYAVGYDAVNDSWWKSPLFQTDLELDSPYNSYLYPGLPPSPIANPGLSSIRAVAEPAQTQFIFFVADCSGEAPGSHNFSQTYDQHVAFVQACR